ASRDRRRGCRGRRRTLPGRARSPVLQLRRRAIGEGFCDVPGLDCVVFRARRDRAREANDSCASTPGKGHALDRTVEQLAGAWYERPGSGVEPVACRDDTCSHDGGRLARGSAELGRAGTRQRDDQIEAIEERVRETAAVTVERGRPANSPGARI